VSDDKEEKIGVEESSESVFSEKTPIATRFRKHEERQDEVADFLRCTLWRRDGRQPKHCESQKSWSFDQIPRILLQFLKLQHQHLCKDDRWSMVVRRLSMITYVVESMLLTFQ
jgi:hypothetical protein